MMKQPALRVVPPIISSVFFPMFRVCRWRNTYAAFELQRADSRVIDVALKYGYSSPTSFNRAFQNVHGITPTAAKLGESVLQAYPSIQFKIEITGGSAMAYRIAKSRPCVLWASVSL